MITCITIDSNGFERKKNSGMIVIIVLIAEKVFPLHQQMKPAPTPPQPRTKYTKATNTPLEIDISTF